ncbi:MAG: hypothetical protein H6595_06360 [Flavobacteriales bacterium]|nr:hypothetical protein [Flavobacteriales bacterium]MCB9167088.1 hypothetical protein [Flavobacteriales bacterium]
MDVRRALYLLTALALGPSLAEAQVAIGQWRDHLPYRQAVAVASGAGKAYCATTAAVFSYDPVSGTMERLTKVNALNDVNIRCLAWDPTLNALLVGYENGNLDMLRGGVSTNLSDIKRSGILGDKAIYAVRFQNDLAYLACGFGIVVMDLVQQEVRDTWLIAPGGAQVKVSDIAFTGDSIYAATGSGLFAASRQAPNLASFTAWHKRPDIPNANGPFTAVVEFGGRLIANLHREEAPNADTLYYYDAGWHGLSALYDQWNRSLVVTADGQQLIVAHAYNAEKLDQQFAQVQNYYAYGGDGMQPAQAVEGPDGNIWIADQEKGLVLHHGGANGTPLHPNGPSNATAYRMAMSGGSLYVTTGGVANNWTNFFLKDGVHIYVNGSWRTIDRTNNALMATGANAYGGAVNDVFGTAVDPEDPTHAFVSSWDEGVIEFKDEAPVTIYDQDNSSLAPNPTYGTDNCIQVSGLAYDEEGNLWMTNSNVPGVIAVRTRSGSWRSFEPGAVLNNNTLASDILPASNGIKWVIRPRGNGMFTFYDGGTISDVGDDRYTLINTFEGQGALPSLDVFAMAEDHSGQIWVGTGKGIAVFYNPDALINGGDFDAQQILIEQDGNVQVLLETEAVTSIVVDGADRKWLGTQSSGVYLVSSDGTEQIHHFTAENSPLPSNTITAMAMDEGTGELFVGTDQGIVSYRGEAIEGAETSSCASVFPNPLLPGHPGPVAITGLVKDSDVKVADVAGNLVYHTTSLGGQAIWPGTDMSGQKVSTGVYLIFAADQEGTYKCKTKMLVVR